jgi:hypothetical protein
LNSLYGIDRERAFKRRVYYYHSTTYKRLRFLQANTNRGRINTTILFLAMMMPQDSAEDSLTMTFRMLLVRQLQDDTTPSRGRTVLMVLYLCVLAMCFVTPIVYYCRLQCEECSNQHFHDLEAAGIATALEQSQQLQQHNREETRAVRRKYIEERRARILQLFAPVRAVCTRMMCITLQFCFYTLQEMTHENLLVFNFRF